MPRRLAVAAVAVCSVALLASPPLRAASPQFWRIEGAKGFLEGDLSGLSLDSEGRLRLGPAVRQVYDPAAPNAWAVARDAKGALYVGTGNDGRVMKIAGGTGSLFFDSEELEVHALAVAPDGRVFAGTSPDGAVYAIDPAGKATRFFDPEEKYIWALAFDGSGNLYVATGGEGRVYKVDKGGKATVVLTASDTHVLSMAIDRKGRLFAGTRAGRHRLPGGRRREGLRRTGFLVPRDPCARHCRGRFDRRGRDRREGARDDAAPRRCRRADQPGQRRRRGHRLRELLDRAPGRGRARRGESGRKRNGQHYRGQRAEGRRAADP